MRIFKLISIIITISLLIQDIAWASPSRSALHPRSTLPDQGFIRKFIDAYTGKVLTDEDRRRIREFMEGITDPKVREMVGEIFRLKVSDLGLCVTGDTLLPIVSAREIRNPKSKIQNKSQIPNSKSQNIELKPIVDVQPGDYVLSLNEETQQIEPHRINGLLDMGTKPVYRLTTASGRSIKTTANHPYLTKNGWVKVSGLRAGDGIGVPSGRALSLLYDDGQYTTLQAQKPVLQKYLLRLLSFLTSSWLSKKRNNKKDASQYWQSNSQPNSQFYKEFTCQSYSKDSLRYISQISSCKFPSNFINDRHRKILYQFINRMSRFFFSELEAAEMGGDILWDRIVSIEYVSYEYVYDIEVEGTHNFIGNGIFAHNTYMDRPTSEIIVETGAIRIDEAREREILKLIENIEVAEWRVRLVDGEIKEVKPINLYIPVEKEVQGEVIGFMQSRIGNALKRLLEMNNYLTGLGKGEQNLSIRLHRETIEGKERRLGRLPRYLPHQRQDLVELHPLALLSDVLLLYGLRHELDHALMVYPDNVELDLSLEEERVIMNDRVFFEGLSLGEQEELLNHLNPENPNGVDMGGKVYRDLYEVYSRPREKPDEKFSFQSKEPTVVFNRKGHRFAYRYIDEDNPIEMVLGNQMIRIIKSDGELIFITYHLYDMTKPAVEFKVDTDRTIKIGRHKESVGIVRDEDGREIGHEAVFNDIDLPISNTTVSRRHIKLTIEDIKHKKTRITFEDLTSKNGSTLYAYGQAVRSVQPKILMGVVKKEEDALTLKKKEMNKIVKELNFRIGLTEEGWQDRIRGEFIRERDRLTQGLTGGERIIFRALYSDRFLNIWIENLEAFREDILFLREMKINLVIRRKGEITDAFRQLVQRQVKMLRRIPIGLLAKAREFFPYVISEEQEEMKNGRLLGFKKPETHGTVMLNNEGFRKSTVFSSASLSSSRGASVILSASELGEEEEGRREEMAVSPETVCAHELYHHLHLDEDALPVRDFIEMLNIAERRRWLHYSMFGRTIFGALPDVVSIIEEALGQGDEEGVRAMKRVCQEYSWIHSTFYTPAEVVSFCLSHDIGAEKELGSQRFHQIRQIGYRKMLRSEKPVANRQIPLYEIYTFRENRHWIDYGDEKGNILIYGNRVIRNDTHKLGENDRRAIEEAVKYKFVETICRDPALGGALKYYINLLAGVIRAPEAQVFFMDDMEKVLGPVENREQIFKIHRYINDAIYTAGYQISFKDRYEILIKIFRDFNPPSRIDSKGSLVNFLAAIVFAFTLFSSNIALAIYPPPSRPPVTLKELVRTRQLGPEVKLRVAWDILADIEPDIYNRYSGVPVGLDSKKTDGVAATNAGEMDVPPRIVVSVPWMEGRLDRGEPKTALYVAMVLRHEIQHIIDAGGVTNIFKWWWVIHKQMFGGEERAFSKEQDLLDRYDRKYNLDIDKSLYQRYDIIIDSKYHLRSFWTKISILIIDIFLLGIIFWGIWRVFLRKRFGKKADELKEKLVDLIDRLMGGDDDNPISSEGTREPHPEYHRQGRFKEVIRQIAEELGLKADRDGRYDLRKVGSRISTSHGELRVEEDGIFVIIDSRFKKDHAGRRQMAVYARNELKVRHELAELRAWIGYAKRELGMTEEDIRSGKLNNWMRNKNRQVEVKRLYKEFHRRGLKAEKQFNLVPHGISRSLSNLMLMLLKVVLSENDETYHRSEDEDSTIYYPKPSHIHIYSPLSIIIAHIIQVINRIEPNANAQILSGLPEIILPKTKVAKTTIPEFWSTLEVVSLCLFVSTILILILSIQKIAGIVNFKEIILASRIEGDVVISSEGPKMEHPEYHRLGRFKEVIGLIAEELGLTADNNGRYDLRKAGSQINTSHGELRIEPDGILVIIDSRFKKDHAGRRAMAVYARNEQKARHELAELRAWIDYAKKELGMTEKGIRDGSLNRWMQDKRNIKKVRELHREFHRKGKEAEREFNIPLAEANASVEEGMLKIDGGDDIERLRRHVDAVISNLQQSFSSRKDIRSILGLISPFKIRFLTNASSSVRIYKEGDAYILELDISSFADWGEFGFPKKLLMAELRRVTADMILDSVETDIPRDILLDIILILLDSQDINRRYRSGNRKVIAKRSRKEYLQRLRHDKGRQYVTLIKRLSHTPDLEEKVRLIYLYLTGKEKFDEISRLQHFFTKNRGILIRIRLAYNNLERRVRIVRDHLRIVDRGDDVDRVPDYAPTYRKDEEREGIVVQKGRDEKVIYEYTTPNRGEEYYLQKIRELLPLLENPDEGARLRIFLGQIFPWYLVARADHADTKVLRDLIMGALSKTVSGDDKGFSVNIQALMATKNRNRIVGLARRLRNNPYLLGYKIYLGVDLGNAMEGGRIVDVLYALVYEIKEIGQFKTYNRRKQDGEDLPIYYLGDRIDNLDKEMSAFGFKYRGDTFGAVVMDKINGYLVGRLLPILGNRPYFVRKGSSIHPLTHSIAKAVKRDLEGVPELYKRVEYITVIHELQHTVDELLKPNIDSVSTEISAYLASIALSECPYVALVQVIELYIDPLVSLFSPSHGMAVARVMGRLMGKLGMDEISDRKDTVDMMLGLALRLEDGMLANFAKEIHKELFGHDALVRLEPGMPVIARTAKARTKQSGAHKEDFGWPKSLWGMPLYVFIILGLSILSLVSHLSLEPIRAKAEEKPLPPIVSPPVREEPRPKQESFEHTVMRRIPDDCLWHIARKYYAVSSRKIERYIAEYNNKNNSGYMIKDIDLIVDGRRIVLPYRIVHKVKGKNVHVSQVARMYNVSEGYLRAMNPHIPLDGRLKRGDEIEIAVRIEPTSDNIGKDVVFTVNADGTITITKKGKRLAENLLVSSADINKSRILEVAKGLNVYKEYGEEFITAFDSVRIMVFNGTKESRSAGAFAHMGKDGVLYIDSVLLNNDMAIIHEGIHAYLKRFTLEELIAKIDKTDARNRIKKKAGDNPALLRHYYARYYLQNPIGGEYRDSSNENLTFEIRLKMAAGLLDNLEDPGESFRLREAFIKLIKEDGEITKDELEILVRHIENVMVVIDQLTGILGDEEKREAITRIALYLSIEEIRRVKDLETRPRGDIRRYFYQRIEVARRLGVSPQEIESINPKSTDVAVVINKYFRDKKERQEVAGKVVDVVTRYLLNQLEVEKKTKDSIERIIRSKNIEILTPLPIVVDVSGKVILQDLSIYLSGNSEWDRENLDNMAVGVIKDLTSGNQQVMAYTEKTQKERFIRLLEEKGVRELQDRLAFIDISQCSSYEDIKRKVSERLDLSIDELNPRLISLVKVLEKRFESEDPKDRIIIAGHGSLVDIHLMWRVALILMQPEGDIRSSLKNFLQEYYKGTEYEGKVSDLVEEMFKHGIYIILPPIVPFMRDYYDAQAIIEQSA